MWSLKRTAKFWVKLKHAVRFWGALYPQPSYCNKMLAYTGGQRTIKPSLKMLLWHLTQIAKLWGLWREIDHWKKNFFLQCESYCISICVDIVTNKTSSKAVYCVSVVGLKNRYNSSQPAPQLLQAQIFSWEKILEEICRQKWLEESK